MAYGGKKDKGLERRMVDLGRARLTPDLKQLRILCLSSLNRMAGHAWPTSILAPVPDGKDLDSLLLEVQRSQRGVLNSVWSEKCRLIAKSAVIEQHKRAQAKLFATKWLRQFV